MSIKFIELVSLLQEKRRNSEVNKEKDNVIEYIKSVELIKNDLFMTFLSVPKLGINPINIYDTPTGIYSYPLTHYFKTIVYREDLGIIPFQRDNPYIYFFKIKEEARILDSNTFTQENLNQCIDKLHSFILTDKTVTSLISNHILIENIKERIKFLMTLKASLKSSFKNRIKKVNLLTKKQSLYETPALLLKIKTLATQGKALCEKARLELDQTEDIEKKKYWQNLFAYQNVNNKIVDTLLTTKDTITFDFPIFLSSYQYGTLFSDKTYTIEALLNQAEKSNISEVIKFSQELKKIITEIMQHSVKFKNLSYEQALNLTEALKIVKAKIDEMDALSEKEKAKKTNIKLKNSYIDFYRSLQELKIYYNDSKKYSSITFEEGLTAIVKRINGHLKHYRTKLKDMNNVGIYTYGGRKYPWKFAVFERDERFIGYLFGVFEDESKKFIKSIKTKNLLAYLWAYTFHVTKFLSAFSTSLGMNIWNALFTKILKVDGVIDHGIGFIHKNEKAQAVFFNKFAIESVKFLHNKVISKKTKLLDFSQYGFTDYINVKILTEKSNSEIKIFLNKYLFTHVDFYPLFHDPILFHDFLEKVFTKITEEKISQTITLLRRVNSDVDLFQKNIVFIKRNSIEQLENLISHFEYLKDGLKNNWIDKLLAQKNNFTLAFHHKYNDYYEIKKNRLIKTLTAQINNLTAQIEKLK